MTKLTRFTRPAGSPILIDVSTIRLVTRNSDGSADITFKNVRKLPGVQSVILDFEQVNTAWQAHRTA